MSGIFLEEYLTANDDLKILSGVTEKDILSEITDEMENDYEENADRDNPRLISQEAIQSVQPLAALFSSVSYTNDYHFRALDYANLVS
ncbi:hypothetical protein AVEN_80853-1 [Araneus ventricosus]|uniref:Uncharacterized protein n=1 Tax=Araneus ventricosus TaxID=182803 RepID=A0A4Y2Q6W7_ARAVE|nr:hypothetical protein AVEN_80853-1 [Araneus ventricosus]